ncbi:XRE family transcriptional regulator [Saccharopolyspora sp. CA-218241]|uniref:XRE family transcriptional regulator n=1 Tax=Saccharopolyspora sp. CA-218241 TaxID=3240027 RepID=UPI003D956941
MTQQELAEAVNTHLWNTTGQRYGLDGQTIARYERGQVRWPGTAYRAGLRAVLGAGDAELGFHPTPRGRSARTTPHRLLDERAADLPLPSRLRWDEVADVRSLTRSVASAENREGGGLHCRAALAHLRWALQLLDVPAPAEVHQAMAEAVGNLASVAAWTAFDIGHHQVADRCSDISLHCADQGRSWALRANTLAETARQQAYQGRHDDALSTIEFAQVRADRLTATARAMLHTIRARLLAVTGRHDEARAEIDRADAHFADRDPAAEPPWLCYYDEAEHQGSTGKALIPIATARQAPEIALPRLETAVTLHTETYPRSRAFSRVRIAALLLSSGHPHAAVPVGHQAFDNAAPVRSPRLARELRTLVTAADPHARIPEVADLRHAISTTTSATIGP